MLLTDMTSEATGEPNIPMSIYTAPVILSNLSIPKAIRLYGVETVTSIMKEIDQLQDKGVWTPIKYENIEDKSKIITLLFLKRKRDGTLKARLLADGRM